MSALLESRHSSSRETGMGTAVMSAKRDAERARATVVAADDAHLEHMGYKPEFRRDFTFLGLFSLVQTELAVLPGVANTIW